MKKVIVSLSLLASPLFALAQGTTRAVDAFSLFKIIHNITYTVIPVIIGLAVLVFIYALFQFVSSAGDEEARAGAKHLIIWSVIGIFAMVSVWGLVNILSGTFNLDNTIEAPVNTLPVPAERQ